MPACGQRSRVVHAQRDVHSLIDELTAEAVTPSAKLAAREFAVLSRSVGRWRATQNKTTNSYVVEIAI